MEFLHDNVTRQNNKIRADRKSAFGDAYTHCLAQIRARLAYLQNHGEREQSRGKERLEFTMPECTFVLLDTNGLFTIK